MTKELKLYSLPFNSVKTYLFALLFIAGNIALPQLCHLIPKGGLIFLPIYLFTLIGAYKYGLKVGLLTAVLSPLVNNLLFAMPPTEMLPVIIIKSVLLATIAAYAAHRTGKASLLTLVAVVLAYQILGGLVEWGITGSFDSAVQDFKLGYPGMLIQIVGGYIILNYLLKR